MADRKHAEAEALRRELMEYAPRPRVSGMDHEHGVRLLRISHGLGLMVSGLGLGYI